MATVRKTITLTDKQDSWIKAQIDAGHYTSDSEHIRDLIRREQERSAEVEAIRAALIKGRSAVSQAPSMPARSIIKYWTRMAEYRLTLPPSMILKRSGLIPSSGGA